MDSNLLWHSLQQPNFPDVLRRFAEAGGNIDLPMPDSGWSLLHFACEQANPSLVRVLVAFGADLNNSAECGYPPIIQALDIDIDGAIQNERPIVFEMTRLLLSLGARADVRDQENRTMREFVALYGPKVLNAFDDLVEPLII